VGDSDVSWITLSSASKAFNIAGLQNAQIIIPDDSLRRRVDRAVNIHEVCDVNPLGLVATEAAYRHGYPWLEQLRSYLHDNYLSASSHLTAHHPELRVAPLQATYLMWLDVRAITNDDEHFCADLCKETGVRLAPGSHYGQGGQGHVRINLATPRRHLLEAMELLTQYIDTLS
jgi:cystathionine beta-lyase